MYFSRLKRGRSVDFIFETKTFAASKTTTTTPPRQIERRIEAELSRQRHRASRQTVARLHCLWLRPSMRLESIPFKNKLVLFETKINYTQIQIGLAFG